MVKFIYVDDNKERLEPFPLARAAENRQQHTPGVFGLLELKTESTPADAMEEIHAHGLPQVIVTDYAMGSENGIDFAAALREELHFEGPIIVCASDARRGAIWAAHEPGITALNLEYCSKRDGVTKLYEVIQQALAKSRGEPVAAGNARG